MKKTFVDVMLELPVDATQQRAGLYSMPCAAAVLA